MKSLFLHKPFATQQQSPHILNFNTMYSLTISIIICNVTIMFYEFPQNVQFFPWIVLQTIDIYNKALHWGAGIILMH